MKTILFKISSSAALTLVFLAMFLPTAYIPLKAIILLLMTLGVIASGLLGGLAWNKDTIFSCFLLALVGLLNSFHGVMMGNLGAVPMLTVMVIWPVVYSLASALLNNSRAFHLLARTLFLSYVVIIIYTLIFVGNRVGFIPSWAYIDLDMGGDVNDLFTEYSLYNITSLTFLIPFAVTYTYLLRPVGFIARTFIIVSVFVSIALVILSGRRALQIILLISPFMTFFTIQLFKKQVRLKEMYGAMRYWVPKVLFVALILMGVAYIAIPDFLKTLLSNFEYAYDIIDNDKENERTDQFYSLINGWISSGVLFGAGNGASVEVIRSEEMPWAYELTYVYLLFSTGIFGVLFYFAWFGWGLIRIVHETDSRPDLLIYLASFVSGVFGISIAAMSNPYISKFDYLWIIFLPHLLAGAVKYQGRGFGR